MTLRLRVRNLEGKFVRAARYGLFLWTILNIWAPDSGWSAAYDWAISPTSNQSSNRNYYFDVDYIRVRSIPVVSGVLGNGQGLTAHYYDNTNFTEWKLSRIDPRINFN